MGSFFLVTFQCEAIFLEFIYENCTLILMFLMQLKLFLKCSSFHIVFFFFFSLIFKIFCMCGGGHTGHGGGQNNLLESTLSYRVGPRDQGYQAQ